MKSHLAELLTRFKRELITIGLFSAVINILMLSPTLYMLQVFDRVMISQSEITLIVLTALVLFFYCVQAFCEWMRSRLMIGVGLHLDAALSVAVFHGTFRDQLRMSGRAPIQSFSDMTTIRQWLTGNGAFAFFDLPWSHLLGRHVHAPPDARLVDDSFHVDLAGICLVDLRCNTSEQ